jgi:hypothetical protein
MQLYKGSCHCGAIKFSFEAEPFTHGERCNCSYCSKETSQNPIFVMILRCSQKITSYILQYMWRRNFLLAPCLTWKIEFSEGPSRGER